jgi:hypothetical protein
MTDNVVRDAGALTGSTGKLVEDANKAGAKGLKANQKDISARMKGPGEVSEAPAIESVVNGYTPPPIGTKAAKPIFEKPLPTDPVIPKIIKPGDAPKFVRELSPEELRMGKDIQKQMIFEAKNGAGNKKFFPEPGPKSKGPQGMPGEVGGPKGRFGLPTDAPGGVAGRRTTGMPGESGGRPGGRFGREEGPGGGGGGNPRTQARPEAGPGPVSGGERSFEQSGPLKVGIRNEHDVPDGSPVSFSPTKVVPLTNRPVAPSIPGLSVINQILPQNQVNTSRNTNFTTGASGQTGITPATLPQLEPAIPKASTLTPSTPTGITPNPQGNPDIPSENYPPKLGGHGGAGVQDVLLKKVF